MAPALDAKDRSQPTSLLYIAVHNLASPAGITQAVVALLTLTLTATVNTAVQREIEQLHIELQAQAQKLSQTEEKISFLEDDSTANSAIFARLSNSHRDICEKLDDLENRSR